MLISFIIICIHFVADFIFQSEEWATNKSKSNLALFNHVITYSTFWLFGSVILFGIVRPNETTEWYVINSLLFTLITFVSHFITDYFTSRIVSELFKKQKYGSNIPNLGAFTMIGFDQVLHYAQLLFIFYMLSSSTQ